MTSSSPWSDKVAASIDALCAPFADGASPGCVIAVALDGESVYQRGFGLADIEKGIPLGPGSVFDVGSLAKQFTALCIALLEEEGVLDLDEDVRRHVPEMPVYDAPVTIRHLIHHTSGLRDYIELLALGGIRYSNPSSPAEALSLITRQRGLNHQPGAEHIYNNSGYVLLSLIAERAAGAPLGELAHRLIFAPLGMHDTRFRDGSAADLRNLALGYVPADGGFRTSIGDINLVGDGALLTTAGNLILWVRSFEENRLGKGKAELIRRVLTPGTLLDGRPIDYAFGHYVGQYRDQALVHHGGTWAGYRSEILHFPGLRLSVICLSNLGSVSAAELSRRIADVYLAELLPAPAAEPESAQAPSAEAPQEVLLPAEALAARTGTFRNMSTGRIWEIGIRDGRLFASSGPLSFALLALGEDHFRAVGAPLAIDLFCTDREGGKVIRWRLEPAGQEPAVLAAVVPALPEDLSDVAGVYHSDELGVTHEITAANGGLLLRMNGLPFQLPLTPVADDQLTVQGVMVRLLRGDDSRVRGFTVSSGRVRHLAFSKQGSAEPLFREGGFA
jgi:CubicO group peptidase (beta-lactamase class C family)